jgi:hypothetical protein
VGRVLRDVNRQKFRDDRCTLPNHPILSEGDGFKSMMGATLSIAPTFLGARADTFDTLFSVVSTHAKLPILSVLAPIEMSDSFCHTSVWIGAVSVHI